MDESEARMTAPAGAAGASERDMERAEKLAARLQAKVAAMFLPLELEMRIMKWEPQFRAILWENVAMEAMARAKAALKP